jgi:hypothetical protein
LKFAGTVVAGATFAGLLANAYDTMILESQVDVTTDLAIDSLAPDGIRTGEQGSELDRCNALRGSQQDACIARAMTKVRLM